MNPFSYCQRRVVVRTYCSCLLKISEPPSNRVLFFIFILVVIFDLNVFAEGGAHLLIFNGGGNVENNQSVSEDNLQFFSQYFNTDRSTFLNTGGPGTQMILINGFNGAERNALSGEVQLVPSKIKNSSAATKVNLNQATQKIAMQNPKAVTYIFEDHGLEKGIAGWHEMIPYADLQSIDSQFGDDTVIRRIHLHCYSGAALEKFGFGKPKSIDEVLQKYPKNRCAFAPSLGDEVSYGFSFANPIVIAADLKKNIAGKTDFSLKDLKDFYSQLPLTSSTPQLTSDLMINDISSLICSQKTIRCGLKSPPINESLRSFVKEALLDVCEVNSNRDQDHEKFLKRLKDQDLQLLALEEFKAKNTIEFLSNKYPEEFNAWSNYDKARDEYSACRQSKISDCESQRNKLLGFDSNSKYLAFVKKYLALLSVPTASNIASALWQDWRTDRAKYQQFLESQYKKALNKGDIPLKPVELDQASTFKTAIGEVTNQYGLIQASRLKYLKSYNDKQRELVNQLLQANPSLEKLAERLANVSKCENSPISSASQ